MMLLESELVASRLVPVVVVDEVKDADPLAEALVEGGLPVAEVTLRTDAGVESIRRMAARGDMLVGAGTVTSADQVDLVADAGATFVVSPGLSAAVVERARSRGLLAVPGVVTPTEVMQALDLGLDLLKFFPAATYGGVATLKALGAPFRNVRFVPTGGVKTSNLAEYLGLPNVAAVGGSWLVDAGLVREGRFDELQQITAEAVATASAIEKDV